MDIYEIATSTNAAICCRSADEMHWLEQQFKALGIKWTSGKPFALVVSCWELLKNKGNCSFGNYYGDGICWGEADSFMNKEIIEAAELLIMESLEYSVEELLELL